MNGYRRKRIKEIDYLRGFAILGVLVIHTLSDHSKIEVIDLLSAIPVCIHIISTFAVPLFVLISGIVLAQKYYDRFSHGSFYKKRALSVVPQYIIFSILYLVPSYVYGRPLEPSQIIFKFLTGSIALHFWFLALIMQLYIFYPYLIRLYEYCQGRDIIMRFLVVCLSVQISWQIICLYINMVADVKTVIVIHKIFLSYVFYFVVGIHVGRNIGLIKEKIASFNVFYFATVSIIIAMIMLNHRINILNDYMGFDMMSQIYAIFDILFVPVFYISIFVLLSRLSLLCVRHERSIVSRIIKELSTHSFGIYLIHVFFIRMFQKILATMSVTYTDSIYIPIVFFSVTSLSYISIVLISYLPHSDLVVGIHKRLPKRYLFSK